MEFPHHSLGEAVEQHHSLGEAVEDASVEGMNFVDWPGSASKLEIRQLRAEGFRVAVNDTGVHIHWGGSWRGDTSTPGHQRQEKVSH